MTEIPQKLRIGVSACLLGREVRYDGTHRRHDFLVEELGNVMELVGVCPEFELGLGVPREMIQLVEAPTIVRMVTVETGLDITDNMTRWARRRVRRPDFEELSGFVLKARSPSCGAHRVKLFAAPGLGSTFKRISRGLFAKALIEQFPLMPIVEAETLDDPIGQQDFLRRVEAYSRL